MQSARTHGSCTRTSGQHYFSRLLVKAGGGTAIFDVRVTDLENNTQHRTFLLLESENMSKETQEDLLKDQCKSVKKSKSFQTLICKRCCNDYITMLQKVSIGTWGPATNEASSNRELCNLVDSLKVMASKWTLDGVEIFFFVDNTTTSKAAFFNRSSSSKSLFNLILKVRKLKMHEKCKVHICHVHVAGTKMITQGSDGLSRGTNLTKGAMKGNGMQPFVPIHLGSLERSLNLEGWT